MMDWFTLLLNVRVTLLLTHAFHQQYNIDSYTYSIQPAAPIFSGFMTGATFYIGAGARAAGLAGTLGVGIVSVTLVGYSVLGIPPGSQGFLFL